MRRMASSEGSLECVCLRPGIRDKMLSIQLAALACCSLAVKMSVGLSCAASSNDLAHAIR